MDKYLGTCPFEILKQFFFLNFSSLSHCYWHLVIMFDNYYFAKMSFCYVVLIGWLPGVEEISNKEMYKL